ncbi:MAG TPA: hypothetical protein VFD15_06565 [Clostridia bacterium]|nr:hypothetical protein [Clostridia bacterium]
MTQIDYIKHLRENEGESISGIARRVKCSWKTAKKYADGEINLQTRGRRKRKKRVMDGYEEWVEAFGRGPKNAEKTKTDGKSHLQNLARDGLLGI